MGRVCPRPGRRIFAALLGVAAFACVSPTLPLPPPNAPSVSVGPRADHVTLTSVAGSEPEALIVVVNRNEALPRNERVSGTFADERGSWTLEVRAGPGDTLDISQEAGTVRSASVSVTIPRR